MKQNAILLSGTSRYVPANPQSSLLVKGSCGTLEDFRRRYSTGEDPTYVGEDAGTKTPKRVVDDGMAGLCLDLSRR